MKALKLWRTFKEGGRNYRRNGWLTFATVSVLTLSLFVISLTALLAFAGHLAIQNLQSKVSITISFQPEVAEGRILAIQNELEKYKEIASVTYVSREAALQDFLSNGDPTLSAAVDVIGENPLFASLVIKASDPTYYELIATQIEKSNFSKEIARINYAKNKRVIERLNNLIGKTKEIGLVIGGIFTLIAILITFNTIRLTIYSQRQEFEVMRLVGASDLYIKMPFFFEGIFYGLTAAVTTILLLGIVVFFLSEPIRPLSESALGGTTLFSFYLQSLWYLLPTAALLGTSLGIISSFIAIRKYLKI